MSERIEDVIAKWRGRADRARAAHGDFLPSDIEELADRLTASLERERADVLKVAEEIARGLSTARRMENSSDKHGAALTFSGACLKWAAELRRIAEGE